MSAEPFFAALRNRFAQEAERLNALDAAVGDGDHGATMLRGLTKAVAAPDGARAKAFMRASGGASGTLFGLILLELETYLDDSAPLQAGLARACTRICDLGEVAIGDKSMVDALAPAIAALDTGDLGSAIVAARAGRDGTKDLGARRGRAQYVEDGGRGHLDPGAVSVVIFLETLQEVSP
ncbi:DAK2 domain-containing protein [Ponticoccus sp. SC2-23]|uniref:DAK2 domain-containing protein n=1 Tax=Alexandriicola marinus TaxID=2081710 RepID=UPI0013DE86C4|nr:DAK2 domain-containing protein [Alexandriicola marinus]MBM1221269.1 DAK2 domain-containing protein [Ponticoccus sp. SC6-9]MBM1225839.1 DAK2 domain-containing protein [Ponticoccus sp. SC6-15]MBM1227991.1 DAK2 domain-containing protein [Ponticoccus sp. SC6-38]MBM1234371.1 DAK2 domain-containing protein [Ponticoccus sp. SC6-45]MBM1238493.1 DAK2 domain-containing protein [Ponticoccus sp. SC6-49]MBM1243762.1 DAK2 domain-containing protein [Ponticoccus sp. SC2-64]MBM1247895.1 DAK2 domain-contai